MDDLKQNFIDMPRHSWVWNLLRHPLFVSVIATGVFGIVLACIGDYLQHNTWIKQKEIELAKSIQEKVFDKRAADVLEDLFYTIARRRQLLKQILFTQLAMRSAKMTNDKAALNRFYDEGHKYSELSEEIEARSAGLVTTMRIFFDWREHQQIIPAYIEIHELFNQIHNKIPCLSG